MDGVFSGWPEDFQRFFIGLELDNSKRYFEANRSRYEKTVRRPMEALVASLEPQFGPGLQTQKPVEHVMPRNATQTTPEGQAA